MEELAFQATFFSFIGKAGDTVSVGVLNRRNVGGRQLRYGFVRRDLGQGRLYPTVRG